MLDGNRSNLKKKGRIKFNNNTLPQAKDALVCQRENKSMDVACDYFFNHVMRIKSALDTQ